MSSTSLTALQQSRITLLTQFVLFVIWGYQLDKLSDYFSLSVDQTVVFVLIAGWFLLCSALTQKPLKHPRNPLIVYSFQGFLLLKAQFCIVFLHHYHAWMLFACMTSFTGITLSILAPWLLQQEHRLSPLATLVQSISPLFALLLGHLLTLSPSLLSRYALLAAPVLVTMYQFYHPVKPTHFRNLDAQAPFFWVNVVWFWISVSGFLLVRAPMAPLFYCGFFLAGLSAAIWFTDWNNKQGWKTQSAGVWLFVQGLWFVLDTPTAHISLLGGINMLGFAFASCKLLIPSTARLNQDRPVHFTLINLAIVLLAIVSAPIVFPHRTLLGIVLLALLIINAFITQQTSNARGMLQGASRFLMHLLGVRYQGLEHLQYQPGQRVVLVANHVSLLDVPMVSAFFNEKLTYPIYPLWLDFWPVRFLNGKLADLYGMKPKDPSNLAHIIHAIREGQKCMVFPEGRLTNSGNLMKIYEGAALIAEYAKADIQIAYLDGAMSLPSSRDDHRHKKRLLARRTVTFEPCAPFAPTQLRSKAKRQHIKRQLFDRMCAARMHSLAPHTLCEALHDASCRFGKHKTILCDHDFSHDMSYHQLLEQAKLTALRLKPHVKPRQILGLGIDRGTDAAAVLFACWMLEVIVAPIPPETDPNSLQAWMDHTHLSAVMIDGVHWTHHCHSDHFELLRQHHVPVLMLADFKRKASYTEKLKRCLQPLKSSQHHPKQIPCLLWLDAKTGQSTVLSQDNLCQQAQQLVTCCDYQGSDVLFNPLPLQSTYSLLSGLLHPLFSGNRLFLATKSFEKKDLFDVFYETQATVLISDSTIMMQQSPTGEALYDTFRMRTVQCADAISAATRALWELHTKAYVFRVWVDPEQAGILAINTPYYHDCQSLGHLLPTTSAISDDAYDLYTDLKGPIVPDFIYHRQNKTLGKNPQKQRPLPFAVAVSPCGLLSVPSPILLDPSAETDPNDP